jgi:peptidyl-prolyl cis-trans isomerase A (cyclophilin A)
MFGRERKMFDPPAIEVPGEGELRIEIQTRLGTIKGRLYEKQAPKTVANFVGLATGKITGKPYFDGVIFHRVIPQFMIQGGDPTGTGTGGPGYVIADEFGPGLKHNKGGLFSMANAGPNTGGSQFFITEVPTPHLDGRHAIFGEVTEGLEIIKAIAREPRDGRDRPKTDVVMQKVTIYRG